MNAEYLNQILNLGLTESKVDLYLHDVVCYLEEYERNEIRQYASWGKSIVKALFSLFVYSDNNDIDRQNYSLIVNSNYSKIAEIIHEKYDFGDYIYVPEGRSGNTRYDFTYCLIALIYEEKGFLAAYDFLLPFLSRKELSAAKKDSKTYLQEYAQAWKMMPVYTILETSGPDHNMQFTCSVQVGNRKAVASAMSKKKAEMAAAEKFISDYSIRLVEKSSNNIKQTMQKSRLTEDRLAQINDALALFGLKQNCADIKTLDEALTHISYSKSKTGMVQNKRSNECLSVLGSNILIMLCSEYILANYGIVGTSAAKEQGMLLDENNLIRPIPKECCRDYLIRSSFNNEKEKQRACIDIWESVLAAIWLKYIVTRDITLEKQAKKITFRYFDQTAYGSMPNYTSVLQEIAEKNGLKLEYRSVLLSTQSDNSAIHKTTVEITTGNYSFISEGTGDTKKASRACAARNAMKPLMKCCHDKDSRNILQNLIDAYKL